MSKIVDFTNRKALTSLPFNKEASEELIKYLLNYKLTEVLFTHEDKYLLKQVLMFIENNSEVKVFDIIEEREKVK